MVPVTVRSGKQVVVAFRFACDKPLRYAVDQLAWLSLERSEWARVYYDEQRARGHRHRRALRALGAKWLKIIFIMWQRHVSYSEEHHLATMARQALRHPEKKSLDTHHRKSGRPESHGLPLMPRTRRRSGQHY